MSVFPIFTTATQSTPTGIDYLTSPFWTYFFLLGIGFIMSLIAVLVAFKYRRQPLSIPWSTAGGATVSAILASLGTQIRGLPAELTWAQAATISGTVFLLGLLFWGAILLVAATFAIVRPIKKRYGSFSAMRAWVALLSGHVSFREWLVHGELATDVDAAWDELACAAQDLLTALDNPELALLEVSYRVLGHMGAPSGSESRIPEDEVLRIADRALSKPIKELTSRLTQTTLNFTFWRVSSDSNKVEFLASFPSKSGDPAGIPRRKTYEVLENGSKSRSGSLAGEAILEHQYVVMIPSNRCKRWPQGGLGQRYAAVAAMPIPCNDHGNQPWAVLCIENRSGLVPLESDLCRTIAAHIARSLEPTEQYLRTRM